MNLLLELTLLSALACVSIDAHGYMVSPAARNSAWRFGFGTPTNYNDNELFCGGRQVQHSSNGGHCGVCGDPWHFPAPRPHERGGQFGRGVITASYTEGQVIPVTIEVSANHRGWYEFRLCNNNNPLATDTQECLDKQLLQLADGTGTRYYLDGNIRGKHTVHVQLPAKLYCSNCVFQWTWVAGNNWGICPNGKGGMGCGPQETFVNCADVSILRKGQQPFDSKDPLGWYPKAPKHTKTQDTPKHTAGPLDWYPKHTKTQDVPVQREDPLAWYPKHHNIPEHAADPMGW